MVENARDGHRDRVDELLDYARAHLDGFKYLDIQRDLDWTRWKFERAVQEVRDSLETSETTLRLVAIPDPGGWLYLLTDDNDPTEVWLAHCFGYGMRFLRTMHAAAHNYVRWTEEEGANERNGAIARRARLWDRYTGRMIEDMGDLGDQLAM